MKDKFRAWALEWAGILLFIVWEAGKRLRGKWRRSVLRAWLSGRRP